MPAMATGLRVALEATLRDWVGLATRAFLEDMIMEFMVSVFEFWYWCDSGSFLTDLSFFFHRREGLSHPQR